MGGGIQSFTIHLSLDITVSDILQRILTRDPHPDKRLRPDSSHRRIAHLNYPTVSKVSRCLGCLALETARQTGQMGQKGA